MKPLTWEKQVLTAGMGAAMILSEVAAQSACYRVEVSGWDESQAFFVEKSDLGWDDAEGKHISLPRMLPDGAIGLHSSAARGGHGPISA